MRALDASVLNAFTVIHVVGRLRHSPVPPSRYRRVLPIRNEHPSTPPAAPERHRHRSDEPGDGHRPPVVWPCRPPFLPCTDVGPPIPPSAVYSLSQISRRHHMVFGQCGRRLPLWRVVDSMWIENRLSTITPSMPRLIHDRLCWVRYRRRTARGIPWANRHECDRPVTARGWGKMVSAHVRHHPGGRLVADRGSAHPVRPRGHNAVDIGRRLQ